MKTFLTPLVMLVSGSLFAQSPIMAPERDMSSTLLETISVSGTGRVTLTPDRYTFTVGVQTVEPAVDDAVRENNTRTAAVVAALKKAGAGDKEVRTSNFSIWPQQQYTEGKLPRITGYQVNNSITVMRDKIGETGRLLQAAIDAGVNVSSGLQFEISDPARGRDEGLRAAFEDARAKAAVLALAAGRTLGRAISIAEGSAPVPQPMMARAMSMKAEAISVVPVEAGTQERVFSVTAIFAFK